MKLSLRVLIVSCMAPVCSFPVFGEGLTLEQVIREVCTKSDSVKMMQESVKKAEGMVKEQWANALPVVSATGVAAENYGSLFGGSSSSGSSSSSRSHSGGSTFTKGDSAALSGIMNLMGSFGDLGKPQTSSIFSAGISFSQPIYTFGKVGTAIEVAKDFNKSAKSSFARNMQTLQLGALDMFFRTVAAGKVADIAQNSLVRKKELNGFLERNFQNGSGSRAQVLKTRADIADQNAQTIITKRDAKVVRMNLNAMMGRQLTDSVDLDTIALLDKFITMNIPQPDEAVKIALTQRQDIKAMKLLAESNIGGAKIYRAMKLPSIAATGSAGYSKMNSDLQIVSPNWNPNWTLGIGAQWTLFDGFASDAKAAQYLSDGHKLEIIASTMEKMAEIEVRSSILECVAADSNYISSQEMFKSAQEGYDLTNSNFKQGSGQFSDLQLSDEQLQQSELGLFNAKYRLIRSRAALQVAMGNAIIAVQ